MGTHVRTIVTAKAYCARNVDIVRSLRLTARSLNGNPSTRVGSSSSTPHVTSHAATISAVMTPKTGPKPTAS